MIALLSLGFLEGRAIYHRIAFYYRPKKLTNESSFLKLHLCKVMLNARYWILAKFV